MVSNPRDVIAVTKMLINSPKVWMKFYDAGHFSFLWGKKMPFYAELFDIL